LSFSVGRFWSGYNIMADEHVEMGEVKGGVWQGWWFQWRWQVSCKEENQEEICLGWHQYNRDLRDIEDSQSFCKNVARKDFCGYSRILYKGWEAVAWQERFVSVQYDIYIHLSIIFEFMGIDSIRVWIPTLVMTSLCTMNEHCGKLLYESNFKWIMGL
jgi:hypothetical protein